MDPTIIVLAGVYGVGKTTLAHQLSVDLDIRQRLCVGAIVRTLDAIVPEHDVIQGWGQYEGLDREGIERELRAESALVARAVENLVDCCHHTGEDYIIEGVQLVPSLLPIDKIKLCIIRVSDPEEHTRRFERPTVTRARRKELVTVHVARTIEEIILREAGLFRIPVFDNVGHAAETSRAVARHFGLSPRRAGHT